MSDSVSELFGDVMKNICLKDKLLVICSTGDITFELHVAIR